MNQKHKRTVRIEKLPPYLFGKLNDLKLKMRQDGMDLIDFGMGNPNIPTPEHIINKLKEVVKDPKTHRYSSSRGIPNLRKAICRHYKRVYDVDLDWDTESMALLGSKEGLSHLMLALLDPGDSVLVTNPTFPVHIYSVVIAGGNVVAIPLTEKTGFVPAMEDIVREIWPKPKIMVLSFPHNPTTACVDIDFLSQIVDFARRSNTVIVHDFAYAQMGFDGYIPPSILQVPGAKNISVEFTTLSKVYSMAGWRVGFCVGKSEILEDLYSIKGYFDYGIFTPVQVAAITALDGPQDCVEETVNIYKKRRDTFIDGLAKIGWHVPKPKATMYLWTKLPDKFRNMPSLQFSELLIEKTGIAIAPGIGFGNYGEGYVRMALVTHYNRFHDALLRFKKFLK